MGRGLGSCDVRCAFGSRNGKRVPEVLLSGNHKKIAEWRLEQSKIRTKERRPDLYEKYEKEEKEREAAKRALKEEQKRLRRMGKI